MSKYIGRLVDIGIGKEAVRGTAETTAGFYLPKVSLSIDDGIDQVVDESTIGVIEGSANASVVGKFAEGEIEGNVYDKSIGVLLQSALGTVNTTGPAETTVYTHTFSVAQSAQHQSLTLFLNDPNQDYKYALAMITSLSLDIVLGQYARYKAAFRSKVGATATISPSYTAENHFLPQHASLKVASAVAGLTGASAMDVRSIKLEIKTNAEDDRKLGSLDAADILNKQMEVEGSVELVFNANTFKTEMLADTAQAMRIRLANTDVTIGTTLNPQITIDLAKVKISKFEKNYENDGIVNATVSFKAFYSLADTSMISVVLQNTKTSY